MNSRPILDVLTFLLKCDLSHWSVLNTFSHVFQQIKPLRNTIIRSYWCQWCWWPHFVGDFMMVTNTFGLQHPSPTSIFLLFNTFRKISIQMGKKPDDNENRQSIKKMIHSEMMDRGLVVDKKKKTRSSRDRSRPVSSYFISRITKLSRSGAWFSIGFIYSRLNSDIAVILLKCFM